MKKEDANWLEYIDESDDDSDIDTNPYSPEEIRIESKMFSIYEIYHWINNKTLELHPDFQRKEVWNIRQKSLLIESLMLRIPIPAFYLGEDSEGNKIVIDGLQRLTTLYSFMNDEYRLTGLEYLTAYNHYLFSELPRKYRTRIEDTQLTVNILDSKCPSNVKFDVFRRVNTGGIPLNPQEIRNAMATQETRRLLIDMSQLPSFLKACRNQVNDKRMAAQELCLRFIAFYLRYDNEKKRVINVCSMTHMLDDAIIFLNKSQDCEKKQILSVFEMSMEKCAALLGEAAFSKQSRQYLVNKPLFTAWSVVMAYVNMEMTVCKTLQPKAVALQNAYLKKKAYFDAVTSSTATKKSIHLQFEMVYLIVKEIMYVK